MVDKNKIRILGIVILIIGLFFLYVDYTSSSIILISKKIDITIDAIGIIIGLLFILFSYKFLSK